MFVFLGYYTPVFKRFGRSLDPTRVDEGKKKNGFSQRNHCEPANDRADRGKEPAVCISSGLSYDVERDGKRGSGVIIQCNK